MSFPWLLKVPPAEWLQVTGMSSLSVLKAATPKSRYWQACAPSEPSWNLLGEDPSLPSSASGGPGCSWFIDTLTSGPSSHGLLLGSVSLLIRISTHPHSIWGLPWWLRQ